MIRRMTIRRLEKEIRIEQEMENFRQDLQD